MAYASTTDTCRNVAEQLEAYLNKKLGLKTTSIHKKDDGENDEDKGGIKVQICRVDELDWWDEGRGPQPR